MTNATKTSQTSLKQPKPRAKVGSRKIAAAASAQIATTANGGTALAAHHRAGTKLSAVVDMLKRETGASLTELTATTGWLSHTVRASLTGLRKRGMILIRSKVGDETRYTVNQVAA